ncbi:MAG: hypothetical protein RI894_2343 [Bacteroidota bacterium]
MHPLFKILLAPFSLLYGLGVAIHDLLYRQEILRSTEFSVPVIGVGNLSVGGSGKTPHVEYLADFLRTYINVGILSRGYKRKTRGFLLLTENTTATDAGDEPMQYFRKYSDVTVAVAENRSYGIINLMGNRPNLQCILLDDSLQHRAVQAGFSILLTEYSLPFTRDYLLPSGRLREWRSGYQRADTIIISKCPPTLSAENRQKMIDEIKPYPHQKIFFSYYEYQAPYRFQYPSLTTQLTTGTDILLISAIANTDYLLDYLRQKVNTIRTLEFPDHYFFEKTDIGTLKNEYERLNSRNKIILTTEKDAIRLELHLNLLRDYQLPIFVLPLRICFHDKDEEAFQDTIADYLLSVRK